MLSNLHFHQVHDRHFCPSPVVGRVPASNFLGVRSGKESLEIFVGKASLEDGNDMILAVKFLDSIGIETT